MLIKSTKTPGVESSAGSVCAKGNKGRLELYAEKRGESFHVVFRSTGNYGKERGFGDFGNLTAEELMSMAAQLTAVAQGQTTSTQATQEQVDALLASVESVEVAETNVEVSTATAEPVVEQVQP